MSPKDRTGVTDRTAPGEFRIPRGALRRRRPPTWQRGLAYVAVALSLLLGAGAVVLAVTVGATPEPRDPVPLAVGSVYTVPDRPPFVGDLVVYGTPPDGIRPELADLGCEVTEGGGPLSVESARHESRIVVGDRGVVPLVSFPGRSGHSLLCRGPAATAAAPLFVVPGRDSRTLVPLAAWCAAALLLPGAAVGAVMLWSSRT